MPATERERLYPCFYHIGPKVSTARCTCPRSQRFGLDWEAEACVELSRRKTIQQKQPPKRGALEEAGLPSARVLIVDDDILIRTRLEEELAERDFEVESATDGDAALARLRKSSYDAVLLDQLLPGTDGLDVLEQIRKTRDAPHVILLTAHGSIESAVEAMKRGAFDYLRKPYNIDDLEALLKRACEMRRLTHEVTMLRGALSRPSVPSLTCNSLQMKHLMRIIGKCAPTDSTVLIQGETGTGKELVAHEVYRRSLRSDKPFMPVNCGALQEQLLESELFGHEKGAFTGASGMRHGLFEVAGGGTLFLDEIGEMHPTTQVKLLRVLQSGEVRRVGGNRVTHVDVRVIASTNKDLADETKRGTFREDLFYRLSVLTVRVPPLRERMGELPHLIEYFLNQMSSRLGTPPKTVSDDARTVLMKHNWPGNVRELENIIELAVVLSDEPVIRVVDLPQHLLTPSQPSLRSEEALSLEQVETEHLLRILRRNDGNKRKTARELGIDTKTLYNKLKKLNVAST